MNFADYYRDFFRSDWTRFAMSLPPDSPHRGQDGSDFAIQAGDLDTSAPHLRSMTREHRARFAVALFWTVLVDEVCYTHFRSSYDRFRALTQYPKFIGNCTSGCNYHLHPRKILACLGFLDHRTEDRRAVGEIEAVLRDSVPVMRGEVHDFFKQHLPEVEWTAFWERCAAELPFDLAGSGLGTVP